MGEDYFVSFCACVCVWRVLHKDIMINIQGTAFVTNCCIIKERAVQRYAKKKTFIRNASSSSSFLLVFP